MSKSLRIKNNTFIDSSSVNYKRQTLEFKMNLYRTHQNYNSQTGETGWCRIAHIPASGGYQQRNITLLLTSSIGTENGYGIIFVGWYNNSSLITEVITGNINLSHIYAIKNSDNSIDIWFYIRAYYRPLHVQILSIYNTGSEPWDVFENTGWIQASEPSGTKLGFSYL